MCVCVREREKEREMLNFVALYHKLLWHSISAVCLLTIKPTFVNFLFPVNK